DPILLKEVLPAKSPHSQGNLSPTKLLGQRSSQNQEEIFDLICQMTSYKLTESTFFKEEPQAVKTLVCQIFTRLWKDHQAKNDGTALFGQYFYNPYMPFKGAIFYERVKPKLGIRVLTNGDTYEYRPDGWKIIKWYPLKTDRRLDVLLKVCESRLRKALKFKRSLKEPEIQEDLSKVVNEELTKFLAEKRQLKVQPIEIDRSKLKGIREEALDTQQKLIVEEEVEEAPKINKIAEEPRLKNEACEKENLDTPILLAKELAFLKLTLQAPQKAGFAEELLADAINEKLFPYFEDTVLILEDEHFILISDYTSKLKELLAI
ncbi:MAG: hypothetical protein IJU40_05285, partial [Desulfovibrionaceae bacterium]|nr:hypothetical protein [Desulfovibrionaceae bacterium]